MKTKIHSKAKDKINDKLKKLYPLLSKEIDENYKDIDFHITEHDEVSGKITYSTAEQYACDMEQVLSDLMIKINEEQKRAEEAKILKALSDEPLGVWGD